jgi:hypothetical protein
MRFPAESTVDEEDRWCGLTAPDASRDDDVNDCDLSFGSAGFAASEKSGDDQGRVFVHLNRASACIA